MNDELISNLDDMIERHGVWVDYIVRALIFHPKGLRRGDVLRMIKTDASVRGRTLPPSYCDTVQAVFNRNNAHSALFRGDPGKALFCLADGKRGVWKLRPANNAPLNSPLAEQIATVRAARWLLENDEAIAASNAYADSHEIPSASAHLL